MTEPVRLQLSRKKGFNLQKWSREVNGLPAVNVARPSKWGNPFVVGKGYSAAACVAEFRVRVASQWTDADRLALSGKNLACWCAPGDPCHADVMLEYANRPTKRGE